MRIGRAMSAAKGSKREYYYLMRERGIFCEGRAWLIQGGLLHQDDVYWGKFWDPYTKTWFMDYCGKLTYSRRIPANPICDILFGFDRERYDK